MLISIALSKNNRSKLHPVAKTTSNLNLTPKVLLMLVLLKIKATNPAAFHEK